MRSCAAPPTPIYRLRKAERLDTAPAAARSVVAQIERGAVNELRTPTNGYGRIAEQFGIGKTRVQRIANALQRIEEMIYAFRDEDGGWHDAPDLLPEADDREVRIPSPFAPAEDSRPFVNQQLALRIGAIVDPTSVSVYRLPAPVGEGDSRRYIRMSHRVHKIRFDQRHGLIWQSKR